MTLPIVDNDNVLSPVCAMLRTKTAYGSYTLVDGDDSDWHEGTSSTAVFWCLKTMDMAGPDDGFVHPECCRANRVCYRADE
jgi:hypothetical protein